MTNHDNDMSDDQIAKIAGMIDENLDSIRRLNDELRRHCLGGAIVITPGIAGLGPSRVKHILNKVALFEDFNPENDPYGQRDCAVMTIDDIKIIWKIDYYDLTRRYHSPDASDRSVTSRIMTVMRADEY